MKTRSLLILLFLASSAFAQDINMNFSSADESYTLDSITAMNIRTREAITFPGDGTITLSHGTGINNLNLKRPESLVYPNPSSGQSTLVVNIPEQQDITISVRNQLGQTVCQKKQSVQTGPQAFSLSLQSAGLYHISIQHSKGIITNLLITTKINNNINNISYAGHSSFAIGHFSEKSGTDRNYLGYEFGDPLRFYCYSGIHTTIFQHQPREIRDYHHEVAFYPCVDADGRSYPVVEINDLVWMAENLAYLSAVSPPSVEEADRPHSYVYGYDGANKNEAKASSNYKTYGVLYNWEAGKTSCPEGWHFSTDDDWKNLEAFLGMSQQDLDLLSNNRGRSTGDVGYKLKFTEYWSENGNGNDIVGFGLLPAGWSGDGYFQELGLRGSFWTSADYNDEQTIFRSFAAHDDANVRMLGGKKYGASVRCVKD